MIKKHPHINRKGSVLLVTLLMVSLLLVIVLAFVAVVRLELRNVIAHQNLVTARANARLGLELAIAQLQETAGPDRRVTGRSDLDPAAIQTHWTGVWRNPVSPVEDPGDPAWRRDDSRKATPELVSWLVSGEAPDGSAPDHRVAAPFGPESRRVLLGRVPDTGASGALDIYAGKVPLERPGTGDAKGSFAYWVDDEGIKAMAGQTNPYVAGFDRLKTFRASQRAGVEILDSGVANLFAPAPAAALEAERLELFDRIRKGTELKFLSASDAQTASLGRILPHITMASYGVHADTLYGGLKRDLSLAFEADDLTFNNMTDFAAPKPGAAADAPPTSQGGGSEFHYVIGAEGPITTLPGTSVQNQLKYLFYEKVPDHPAILNGESNYTAENKANGGAIRGNTWHQLRDYYRTYKRVQNPLGNATLPVQAVPYGEDMLYSNSDSDITGKLPGQQSDIVTQSRQFYRTPNLGWQPISRPLGNPMVPVLTRERWVHSFSMEAGPQNGIYEFDFVLAPIYTLWNPYNVAITMDALEIEKFRLGSYFIPALHSPKDGQNRLWDPMTKKEIMVSRHEDSTLIENYPGLTIDNGHGTRFNWSVLMRINSTGEPGGGAIRFEPGELKVFTVGQGSAAEVDPTNSTRLLLYLKPFELADLSALHDLNGLIFEDAWTADIRNSHPPGTPEYNDHQEKLDRITEADGSYNPELVISSIPKDPNIQGSGGAIDILVREDDQSRRVARHQVRFAQGAALGGGAVWHIKDIMDAYPMEGIWPRNFPTATDYWHAARGHRFLDLNKDRFGQHAFMMTDYFMKPENYAVLFNRDGGRASGRFPVPVTGYFNPTAPIQWLMTGVQSPHPLSDIWDGFTSIVDGPEWTTVPPYPGLAGFEPQDEIIDPDGKGFWGRAYDTRSPEAANRVVMREIPIGPILSVGAFRHANLSLYDSQPMYTAGESLPSPYVAPDRVWETGPFQIKKELPRWSDPTMVDYRTQVDWTYLVNEALWDRYYFSGIAPDVVSGSSLEDALTTFIDGGEPLANARIVLIHGRGELLRGALDPDTDEPTAESPVLPSQTTFNRGAFNINSTSVEAWRAMLSATLGVDVLQRESGSITADGAHEVPFPRQTIPVSESGEPDTWQKYKGLDADRIETLATALVAEIRRRGPFTSLSDFVNRRLAPAGDETALAGTIQAALDTASGINEASEFTNSAYLRDPDVPPRDPRLPADFPYPEHLRDGVLRQSAVSNLTQGDILQVIGPALSARSDTFKIICYGDSVDPVSGEFRSRAYAEAVVQRFPDPVFPSATDPFEPENPERFGRRFRIISFNWLNEELDATL